MERMSNFYDGEEITTIYDRLCLYVYPIPSWQSDVVTTSWLMLSQRCGKVENESCGDVSFRRCANVVV